MITAPMIGPGPPLSFGTLAGGVDGGMPALWQSKQHDVEGAMGITLRVEVLARGGT